jgi:hypothetical protein
MSGVLRDLLTILAAFIAATLIALAAGASSLGVALTFGQIAFAAALVWVMLRR